MGAKYQSLLLLILISWSFGACSTDRKDTKHFSQSGPDTTDEKPCAFSNIDLGQFGKHYEKTNYLLQLLKEQESGSGYDEVNSIKIDLAESLRATGNYQEGISFLTEITNSETAQPAKHVLGRACGRMAAIYYELYTHNKDQDMLLDSTFHYAFKALEIARQTQNYTLETSTLNIIGGSYIHKEDYLEAENLLLEAEHIMHEQEMEPDLALIANLSLVKHRLGSYDEALLSAQECFLLAAESEIFPFVLIGLQLMTNAYEALGEDGMNNELRSRFEELASLKDPILESLMVRQLVNNYEQEMAEDRISFLRKERVFLVRLGRILLAAVILLSGLIALLVVYFRQKQKSVRLQNELLTARLESEKLKIENTELLLKQQEAGSKILKIELESKESALASKLLTVSKQNEFLIHLLKKIKQVNIQTSSALARNSFKEIIELIKNQVQLKNWAELENMYSSGNSGFILNLSKAHPSLTSSEKRLCLLLHMNLSTKEISDITMQSCRAIEMARHRLRVKFGIDRNENLNAYLSSFV